MSGVCIATVAACRSCRSQCCGAHDGFSAYTRVRALPQVEARKLKPNTKLFYQWRYRQNDRAEPVRCCRHSCCSAPTQLLPLPAAAEPATRVKPASAASEAVSCCQLHLHLDQLLTRLQLSERRCTPRLAKRGQFRALMTILAACALPTSAAPT